MPRFPLYLVIFFASFAAAPVEKDDYVLTWTGLNWEGGISVRGRQMEWEATLSGKLSAPAGRQIVGYVIEVDEVIDDGGRSLLPTAFQKRWSNPRRPRKETQVHRVLGRRGDGTELGGFSISLGGGTEPAKKIARVRGMLYVM